MALFDFAAHAERYPPIVPPLSAIVSLAKALPGQHLITTMFTMPDVLEGFRQVYPMARTNATPSGSRDLLQMAPYKVCVDQGCSLIVATPAEPARDIVIALAHRAGVHSIALYCPITFVSHGPKGRSDFLERERNKGTLGIILGPPVAPGQVQNIWLILAETQLRKSTILWIEGPIM
jgi:hypothetical protein